VRLANDATESSDIAPIDSADAEESMRRLPDDLKEGSVSGSLTSRKDDGEDEDSNADLAVSIDHNKGAFRSSSSSGSDDENSEREGPSQESEITPNYASEWDKALRKGKPSKGNASNFFTAPIHSMDVDSPPEFFSAAHDEAVKEAASGVYDEEEDSVYDPDSVDPNGQRQQQQPPRSEMNTFPPPRGSVTLLPPPPPSPLQIVSSNISMLSGNKPSTISLLQSTGPRNSTVSRQLEIDNSNLESGVLPDVLMSMRQKIESLTMFDSDMLRLARDQVDDDPTMHDNRESLKRSSQQSISAAVLVGLAHKRYERRRLAALEIEKTIRQLVYQKEIERVRAILLLLSDDYVRSTNEDARKGGVVALAACAIGLKKAELQDSAAEECRDLILASVVHACQDHSQRVRYYATESLYNTVKAIPNLAVQHFFILYEILRSLYADVDGNVRGGAETLDKTLKQIIVSAINAGLFAAEDCVPVFARFVYLRNKSTNRLTLTWLQELNEKLVGSPILEFLHLFLGGIFDMVADPTMVIRQSALAFLQSVLPKLLVVNTGLNESEMERTHVDFDKILQSLVTTMEHPDPFVRKVAMYWMSRILKAHISKSEETEVSETSKRLAANDGGAANAAEEKEGPDLSAASASVRNSLPHVLPGILLSIGDDFNGNATIKDTFLPDQTTRSLAEQANACLQDAVRRDGPAYVQHLDGFIVALREELDSPGGLNARNLPAVERSPYRMDVKQDGTGIESSGWFRQSSDSNDRTNSAMLMSRLCALQWVVVLYESVVPDLLKADYAREFIFAIIYQLVDSPPKMIVFKSLKVLAKITVPVPGEEVSSAISSVSLPSINESIDGSVSFPMDNSSVLFALNLLEPEKRCNTSRNREVFSALIQLHSYNEQLLAELSSVISYMCTLQPPEFVMISFCVELERFVRAREGKLNLSSKEAIGNSNDATLSRDLHFVSSFIQNMSNVLLNSKEAISLKVILKDCVGKKSESERDDQRLRLFHILLHSFAHNLAATISLSFWAGANRTAYLSVIQIDTLDLNLKLLLEIDRLVEMLERPLFRHLHVRMLERDTDPWGEGSGSMLFQALKALLMILPQSTCFKVLKDRLVSVSLYRRSTATQQGVSPTIPSRPGKMPSKTEIYADRVKRARALHCAATWQTIRAESLEEISKRESSGEHTHEEGSDRRQWLGYGSREEQRGAQRRFEDEKRRRKSGFFIEELQDSYNDLGSLPMSNTTTWKEEEVSKGDSQGIAKDKPSSEATWKQYWVNSDQ
jgi:hypothetical protein